jgi:hypothetical protein
MNDKIIEILMKISNRNVKNFLKASASMAALPMLFMNSLNAMTAASMPNNAPQQTTADPQESSFENKLPLSPKLLKELHAKYDLEEKIILEFFEAGRIAQLSKVKETQIKAAQIEKNPLLLLFSTYIAEKAMATGIVGQKPSPKQLYDYIYIVLEKKYNKKTVINIFNFASIIPFSSLEEFKKIYSATKTVTP